MAIKIESVNLLKSYFEGVVNRANHHAQNISEIIYTLLGIIILKMDVNSTIEVKKIGQDATGNVLWVLINGKRYAFRYEHSDNTIEIKEGSLRGAIVLKVDNTTTIPNILSALS